MVAISWLATIRCCCICDNFFDVCKNLVTEWKHVISTKDMTTFNEILVILSSVIVELENIDESSQKEKILILTCYKLGGDE